jgi:hypothetical protein
MFIFLSDHLDRYVLIKKHFLIRYIDRKFCLSFVQKNEENQNHHSGILSALDKNKQNENKHPNVLIIRRYYNSIELENLTLILPKLESSRSLFFEVNVENAPNILQEETAQTELYMLVQRKFVH